jgi:hypothetical protein
MSPDLLTGLWIGGCAAFLLCGLALVGAGRWAFRAIRKVLADWIIAALG